MQVIEDFAHHPTAVGATIESFQKREGSGRLFSVFEPRSNTSRRKIFQKEYVEALKKSDEVFLARPIQGSQSLSAEESLDVDAMVEEIAQSVEAQAFSDVEEAIEVIANKAQKGDTVLIMSNGGFQGIYQKILERLNKDS